MLFTSLYDGMRAELLADYLKEYEALATTHPAVAAKLSFDAFVQFSVTHDMAQFLENNLEDVKSAVDYVKDAIDEVNSSINDVETALHNS